jgi:hypothetical protein
MAHELTIMTASRNDLPAQLELYRQCVGWVERSDAHQLRVCEDDGFREQLNPSCVLLLVAAKPRPLVATGESMNIS